MFQSQRSVSAPPRRLIVTPTEIPTVAKPSPLSLDMGHNYGSQLGIQPPSGSPQLEARLRAPSLGISAFHKHDSTQNIIPFENAISKQRPAAGCHIWDTHRARVSLGSLESSDDAGPGRYELFSFKPSFS
ncbi:conserved hypothetical protein [Coccidioides posadasii str. Silveira]|uniref:Uncharacterized protein n=1 Tax=Coccidioides posadasii (strain RMSCC 757 / Silveira) TaxID=443226 RepID=E9DDA6_COCPS|nr:conserved hypothetical protein [Coccidioides posadasii str. Silveira]